MEEKRTTYFLDGLEENLLLVPLIASIFLVILDFILGFILGATAPITLFCQQLSYYLFAWYISIVLGVTIKKRMYLVVDIFSKMFPKRLQRGVAIINELFELIAICVFLFVSFQVVGKYVGVVNENANHIPLIIAYASLIPGFTIAFIRKIERFVKEGIKS
ncbi:TRAP transporter small permease [Hominifimenecus sp. rT4P-3]|uniref:TRAP transporter small permease n=1 Tax=Hominifimenecus sp. rT4P-3 TaxID=3242979 RepID=UPI003DA2F9FD